jgi:F-type H+-transporting ATPase subunit epsilon
MAVSMDVSIVSAEKKMWEGQAEMVVARSPEGEFGIMHGHIPFLAALIPGKVTIQQSGGERLGFLVTGGFLEASGSGGDYHVIVLADDAREVGDIDPAEAQRLLADERRREEDVDQRAEAEMRAAMARPELGRD